MNISNEDRLMLKNFFKQNESWMRCHDFQDVKTVAIFCDKFGRYIDANNLEYNKIARLFLYQLKLEIINVRIRSNKISCKLTVFDKQDKCSDIYVKNDLINSWIDESQEYQSQVIKNKSYKKIN